MALRTKTIEYAWPYSTANVFSLSMRDYGNVTIYIPETTNLVFESVCLEFFTIDTMQINPVTSVATNTAIKLGSANTSTINVSRSITHTAEQRSFIVISDFTDYFANNWSGTSMNCSSFLEVRTGHYNNSTAKIKITYQYDDTNANTRIKTVKIPVDGNRGGLSNTFFNLANVANQIPNLSTFLPEANVVFRDIFFETIGHTTITAAAPNDIFLNLRFDGANTISCGGFKTQMATDTTFKRIDKLINIIDTTKTNNVEASTSDVANGRFNCLGGVLVVTYEYNHTNTSNVLNSIQIPLSVNDIYLGPFATDYFVELSVQEPNPITLVQSGMMINYMDSAAITLTTNINGNSSATFSQIATTKSGNNTVFRRFDSTESLTRGNNSFKIQNSSGSSTVGSIGTDTSILLYLNYKSGKHSEGDGAHNHTTNYIFKQWGLSGVTRNREIMTPLRSLYIPEQNYYINSSGFEFIKIYTSTSSVQTHYLEASVLSGELYGNGWIQIFSSSQTNDGEQGVSICHISTNDVFKRYSQDSLKSNTKLNILEESRVFKQHIPLQDVATQYNRLLTYHSIYYTITGTISGSSGGTIQLRAYRKDTEEEIGYTSRTGDGSYSIIYYDNTVDVYVVAYENSSSKGVSVKDKAGNTNFDITMSSGTSATYYARM